MSFRTWSALAGAICLLGGHAVAQSTWTVAPTGPADFASVSSAVSAVAEGDILLIAPGDYGNQTITKSLTLLGSQDAPSRPRFNALVVDGASSVQLYHLETNLLRVEDVPGRSRIEDLLVKSGATLTNVGELFMRGCEVRGPIATSIQLEATRAMTINGQSRVQITDSTIRGGDAFSDPVSVPYFAGQGMLLSLSASGRVTLVSTDVTGGSQAIAMNPALPFLASGGAAIVSPIFTSGALEIRGSSFHGIRAGASGPGEPLGSSAAIGVDAFSSLSVDLGENLEVLGTIQGNVGSVPARPYAQWTGTGGPASTRTFEVFGPAGDVAVGLFCSGTTYDPSTIPAFGSALTVELNTLLFRLSGVLQGQDSALGFGFSLPPDAALTGQALPAQAAVVRLSDFALSLTNGDDLLISF